MELIIQNNHLVAVNLVHCEGDNIALLCEGDLNLLGRQISFLDLLGKPEAYINVINRNQIFDNLNTAAAFGGGP